MKKVNYLITLLIFVFSIGFFDGFNAAEKMAESNPEYDNLTNTDCGSFEGLFIIDPISHEAVIGPIYDGQEINFNDIPSHAYLLVQSEGDIESVVIKLNGDQILENFLPYTYPNGAHTGSDWYPYIGDNHISISLYSEDYAHGSLCDHVNIDFEIIVSDAECEADAGTLNIQKYVNCGDEYGCVSATATPNGDIHVPNGFSSIFVLTSGPGLVIEQVSNYPEFYVCGDGLFTIHTLVYDPSTLDLGIVVPGQTTGVDVLGVVTENDICASLDVAGAPFIIENPRSGSLTAVESEVILDGPTTIAAIPNGDANVPANYELIYVLTKGPQLVIVDAGAEPSFVVSEEGDYTIHTLVYNPSTLDLGIVVPGVTTGVDVFGLITEGGGEICASLDVAGAPIHVTEQDEECGTIEGIFIYDQDNDEAIFGPIQANDILPASILNEDVYIVVETNGAIESAIIFVNGIAVLENSNPYTFPNGAQNGNNWHPIAGPNHIYAGVFSEDFANGGLCDFISIDFSIGNECTADAGTLHIDDSPLCADENGCVTASATPNGDIHIPNGFSSIFVLTSGPGLVIEQVNSEPTFDVCGEGLYTIHTLVYDPSTLDLGIVVPGVTTGVDVLTVVTDNGICASLDVVGAPFIIENPDAGTLSADQDVVVLDGPTMISATPNGDANVPDGYSTIFVLTTGPELIIVGAATEPSFVVNQAGDYTIHTLVYNPATLDLGIVIPGITTGVDVFWINLRGRGCHLCIT